MNPLIVTALTGAIDLVIGKLKNNEPVDTKSVIEAVTPEVIKAEQALSDNAKDAWVAELHNGGFMATNWRPLAAIVSITGLAWEGIALPIVNTMVAVSHPPEYVSTAFLYTLLTLIGVRGIEKINIVRKR